MALATGGRNYVSKRKFKLMSDDLCTHVADGPLTVADRKALQRAAYSPVGLTIRPTYCPRCSQLLQQEPAFAYCRWGCARFFPIVGASYVEQYRWELTSGLVDAYRHATA